MARDEKEKLSMREWLGALGDGARGQDKGETAERAKAVVADEEDVSHAFRERELRDERRALTQREPEVQQARTEALARKKAADAELETVDRTRPSMMRALAFAVLALIILVGDGASVYSTLADSIGVPLDGTATAGQLFLAFGLTMLVIAATAYAGILAVGSNYPPFKRGLGWLLLLALATVVALLRGASGCGLLALLGFVASLIGGLAAGEAKQELAAFFVEYSRFKRERDVVCARLDKASREIDACDKQLAAIGARRHAVAVSLDRLPNEAGEMRRRAEQRATSAQAAHEVGAWLAGRKPADEPDKHGG